MSRFVCAIVVLLILGAVHQSTGYKWVTLKPGDPMPSDSLMLDKSLKTYVGRAQHFNLLLPAEVYNSSYARIYSCSKTIIKHQFEVLVASEKCYWKLFDNNNFETIPENIVRAGYSWNGQPIYIGKTGNSQNYPYNQNTDRIASIYLTTREFVGWEMQQTYGSTQNSLSCDDQNNWVDTSALKIPNNTISGGKSEDGSDIFVARLLKNCNIIAGQVIPDLGFSTALDFNGNLVNASLCQVLVGDPNDYSWIPASDGEIPDYAVVAGKINNELMYVSRIGKTLGYVRYNELREGMNYEVLARNFD